MVNNGFMVGHDYEYYEYNKQPSLIIDFDGSCFIMMVHTRQSWSIITDPMEIGSGVLFSGFRGHESTMFGDGP